MTIRVGLVGYGLIGKRVADAVCRQEDMELAAVFDEDPNRWPSIEVRGFDLVRSGVSELAARCDVIVSVRVDGTMVYAASSVHMESITIPDTVDCIRAALGLEANRWLSIQKTDLALGIAKERRCYERQNSE